MEFYIDPSLDKTSGWSVLLSGRSAFSFLRKWFLVEGDLIGPFNYENAYLGLIGVAVSKDYYSFCALERVDLGLLREAVISFFFLSNYPLGAKLCLPFGEPGDSIFVLIDQVGLGDPYPPFLIYTDDLGDIMPLLATD